MRKDFCYLRALVKSGRKNSLWTQIMIWSAGFGAGLGISVGFFLSLVPSFGSDPGIVAKIFLITIIAGVGAVATTTAVAGISYLSEGPHGLLGG